MLKIKTYLDKSPIYGLGLFADQDMYPNTVTWEFDYKYDLVFKTINIDNYEFLKKYCYYHHGKYYLCMDNARFMNHSKTPNIVCHSEGPYDFPIQYDYTNKSIKRGEELTCDYSTFDDGFEEYK